MIGFIKHIVLAICLQLFPLLEGAYAQSNELLTLEDCLEKTIDKNSDFLSIQNMEIIREQNRKILKTALFPELSFSSDINQFVQNSKVVFTDNILPVSEITGARTSGMTASVNTGLNLVDWGQTVVQLKAQNYSYQAQNIKDNQSKNEIILMVCKTYFDCLISQEIGRVVYEKIENSQQIMSLAALKVEIGASDSLEYYQALINYEQDVNSGILVNSMLVESKNNLKILVGLGFTNEFNLDNSLLNINDLKLNSSSVWDPETTLQLISLENDLLEIQKLEKANRWDILPDISLFAGYGFSNQTFQNGIVQQNTALGFSYGLSVNYRFGSVKNTIHQNNVLKIQESNKILQINNQKNVEQNEFNSLQLRIEQLSLLTKSSQTVMIMTQRTLKNSMLNYELGSMTLTDLRFTQDQYLNSKIELNRVLADYFICHLELYAQTNNLEEWILQIL